MKEVNNEALIALIESLNGLLKDKMQQDDSIMSSDISALAMALSKAQAVIENVSKDKQAYGYKYADLANCLAAIKKPFADNDLSISQIVSMDEDKKPVLITLLIHKSGQWLKSTFPIENVVTKQGNSIQHLGAGLTYTRRYALTAIVGLTQEDDDAQSCNKEEGKSQGLNLTRQASQQNAVSQEANQQLKDLCKQSGVDTIKFTKFHGISSDKPDTVINGVDNFPLLKQQFRDYEAKQNANTH